MFERKVRQEGKLQLQHANLTHKHLLKGELMLMELRVMRTGCECNVTFSCFFVFICRNWSNINVVYPPLKSSRCLLKWRIVFPSGSVARLELNAGSILVNKKSIHLFLLTETRMKVDIIKWLKSKSKLRRAVFALRQNLGAFVQTWVPPSFQVSDDVVDLLVVQLVSNGQSDLLPF